MGWGILTSYYLGTTWLGIGIIVAKNRSDIKDGKLSETDPKNELPKNNRSILFKMDRNE